LTYEAAPKSCIIPIRLVAARKFSELVRPLEEKGFKILKEKGFIRYYAKPGWDRLIRVDFHGSREVPTGTCHAIFKAAGLKKHV
jgi:predicted RNA binding protein YcfA (HicA-like mRNA interferase family)